jgi:hypothetical protein
MKNRGFGDSYHIIRPLSMFIRLNLKYYLMNLLPVQTLLWIRLSSFELGTFCAETDIKAEDKKRAQINSEFISF